MTVQPEPVDGQHIEVTTQGPYVVSGSVPLRRRRIIRSERDEAITWETTEHLPGGESYALCRCGGSANKPFCDGTHKTRDWDGTQTADPDTYDQRSTTYPGEHVVVRDDRTVCAHAGFCGNKATNVWKMVGTTNDTQQRSHMMAMIERCPSGALTYRIDPGGPDLEPDVPPAVSVIDDGPLEVTGGIAVTRSDGVMFETRNRMTLCRCGASKSKPLCDGSHAQVGFSDRRARPSESAPERTPAPHAP